jgi:hypothetical protein
MWQNSWKHSNTHVTISLFFGLKFYKNVKNKYEKGIIDHFFLIQKNHYISKNSKLCCDISLLVLVW